MNKINDIITFEDWETIRCRGEFEVTSHKLIVQEWQTNISIILADDAGKKGSKLTKYSLQFGYDKTGCDLRNYLTDNYGNYSIGTLLSAIQSLTYDESNTSEHKAEFGPCTVYLYTNVKGHTLRPSWWKPTGKSEIVKHEISDLIVTINTNKSVVINDKTGKILQIFLLGDEVEQGSYNMTYTGEIIDIKAKYIEVCGCPCGNTRMTIEQFVLRNYDLDLKKIAYDNANWMD